MDLDQAREFLSAITSADPKDNQISFQTFDDVQDRKDKTLARVKLGTLKEYQDLLIEMNQKKAGVFFAVNRVDGHRSIENVTELRAAFIDCDEVEIDFESLPLQPSIVVQSGRGAHAYWLLERGESLGRFREVQRALAYKFGSDMKVCDLPRVMRVPGFYHQKKDPSLMVELVYCEVSHIYTIDELFEGLDLEDPPEPAHTKSPTYKDRKVTAVYPDITPEEKIRRCQGFIDSIVATQGSGGHADTLQACRAGHDFDVDDATFWQMLLKWNQTNALPPWTEEDLRYTYEHNASKYPRGNKLHDERYQRRYSSAADVRLPDDVPWSDEKPVGRAQFEVIDGIPDDAPPMPPDIPLDAKPAGNPNEKKNKNKSKGKSGRKSEKRKKRTKEEFEARVKSGKRVGMSATDVISPKRPFYSDIDRDDIEASYLIGREYHLAHEGSGQWYIYDGTKWIPISKFTVEKVCMQYTTPSEYCINYVNETINRLRPKTNIEKIKWNQVGETEIPVLDGVLDFATGAIRPHDPQDFLERVIPYSYNPDAKCPTWHRCLEEWLPKKKEEQEAIQLFLGYCLMPHARYKKALMLWGDPHTGKSQICSVATELVGGMEYTCGILPSKMNDARACAPIKGKALNVIPDLPKDQLIGDGGFKQMVSTGDIIQIDEKHIAPQQYMPTAKHIYATNNLPSINDPSSGVFERLMIIHFEDVIPEGLRDPNLETKIKKEIEGVLAWAVEGAKKLYALNGRWPKVHSSSDAIEKYKLDENPVYDFIEESGQIIKDPTGRVSIEKFTELFNDYHSGRTWTKKSVRSRLESLGYKDCRIMVGSGSRKTKKRGILGLSAVGEHLTLLDGLENGDDIGGDPTPQ